MYHIFQNKQKNETFSVVLNSDWCQPIIKNIEFSGNAALNVNLVEQQHLPQNTWQQFTSNTVNQQARAESIQAFGAPLSSSSHSITDHQIQAKSQAKIETMVSWPIYDLHNTDVTTIMVWNEAQDHVLLLSNNNGEMITESDTEVFHVSLVGYIGTNNDVFDVLAIIGHIINQKPLSGDNLLGADINQDGSINLFDVLQIVEHIIGSAQPTEQRIVGANGELISTMSGNSPQYHIVTMGDVDQSSVLSPAVDATTTITHGAFVFGVVENSSFVATANLQDTAISLLPDYQLTGVDASLFALQGTDISFVAAPNFEQPGDADADNRYQITLEAVYDNYKISQLVVVAVLNEDESLPASPQAHAAPVFLLDTDSGNNTIDNLLMGSMWGQQLGQGMDISYSFYDKSSLFSYTTDALTTAFGDGIKAVISDCFGTLSKLTLLNFSWLEETQDQVGDIRLGYQAGSSYGAAFGPAQWESDSYGGDVYFKSEDIDSWESTIMGDFYYATVFHEIGHALGLEHPHSTGNYADNWVFGSNSEIGSGARDAQPYTLMSYATYQGGDLGYTDDQRAQTFMVDDIAALQYLYGSNLATAAGASVYGLQTLTIDQPFETTIWDGGGTDLIDWRHGTLASIIDLSPGNLSFFSDRIESASDVDIGQMVAGEGILGIAYGTDIENAYGGQAADVLLGNNLNNVLYGGPDKGVADQITGGDAADYFICTLADGSAQSGGVDRITDYTDGEDKIALNAGLKYDDLFITHEAGNVNSALIEYKHNNNMLIILENVDYTLIDVDDFVTYEFV